ncbi:glycosyltransferase family 4 protein [Bordetella avium]|uniref:glycosyltransferase family 4 protein n=1 Tax=Bordetella avium TaxID=521 RepID=UPI000E0C43D4|nr:glycosyltransferase family 4 protein [Bordetella avium]RIQ11927.1 glycosyltransferase [Bordetella avium]RIQ37026.1 glycosyltransferase [Bordetella avium]RIQ39436.1 glycosyltransferase [Bordetella avium]RIQ40798.1 glycosyltransferase [Bordetella avium]RIQ47281.1 glycosyltransferase [Bordetella avium]
MKTSAGAERRLRIALLVDRFGKRFGGAEAYGVELMRVLACRHDITIIARDYDSDLRLDYLPVKVSARLPSWMRVLYFACRAARYTRGGRFDIVHSHMNGWSGEVQVMHVTPVRYSRLHGLGPLRRLATWLSPRLATYLWLERQRVAPGKRVVAVSQLIVEQLHDAYGPSLRVDTILPGVHSAPPIDAAQRRVTRQELGLSEDDIACLLVARNPLRKGLPALVEALACLPARYRLLVVGADGPTREAVMASSAAARVSLVSPTPDVGRYYEAADLYVHPTLNDSFGMAPLEAMAHGLPVVISPPAYCGFSRYLSDGVDALILRDPHDGVGLARAIQTLGEDAGLRARLIQGGRSLAQQQSWEAVAGRYEALYEQILSAR